GKYVALDAAARSDEEGLNVRSQTLHRAGDRETGVQVPAGTAPREDDPHVEPANGFVALEPTTRSRLLPMFTRTPVRNMVSTRFERPYDTNGSVSPVVGSSPTTTPMWR